MSDLERFIEVLKIFNCVETKGDKHPSELGRNEYYIDNAEDCIQIHLGTGKGYSGFFGIFTFDRKGKAETFGLFE
jgi:hypothetical protein